MNSDTLIQFLENIFSRNQAYFGILLTAGLTFLLYMYLLRINNFFDMLKQYNEKIKISPLIIDIYIKDNCYRYKKSHLLLNDNDVVFVTTYFNFFMQLEIMYRLGLINRHLVQLHFRNILLRLDKNSRDLIDFIEENSKKKEISNLISELKKR